MRGGMHFEVRQRLRRIVDHIDAHAESMPRIDELAGMAQLSPFHFIRFYKKHVGETPGETALRLRLARARLRLAGGASVTAVASAAGYASVQAFSHAFQRVYGATPSRVTRGARLPLVPPRLEWLSDVPAAGIRYHGLQEDAASAFDRVVALARASGLFIRCQDVLGMVYGSPFAKPEDMLRLDAVLVNPPTMPRGLESMTIVGGLHVVLRSLGPLPTAADDLRRLVGEILPERQLTPAAGPVLCRPLRDPAFTAPSERLWELFLPVRRANIMSPVAA